MTRPPAGGIDDRLGGPLDALPRAEQQRRLEIPLHASVVADPLPGLVERRSPVQADHVTSDGSHRLQEVRRARAEMNRRRVDLGEDPRRVRRDEFVVVLP